jgi:hypothetical protein
MMWGEQRHSAASHGLMCVWAHPAAIHSLFSVFFLPTHDRVRGKAAAAFANPPRPPPAPPPPPPPGVAAAGVTCWTFRPH